MHIYSLNETPGRTAFANGSEYLFFSGYDYLGMQHVPEFIALVKEGIDKYGWLFPSSRISNTRLQLFETCEALLSSLTGTEDTLLVSSGFAAGRIATEPWQKEIVNLSPSHPAITRDINNKTGNFLAVDSVDPLNAAVTDFSFTENSDANRILIIDDSHGIGLLGKRGEGIVSALPVHQTSKHVFTYALSKAFSIPAGAISCSKKFAGMYRNLPAYTAATAPSPAFIHAFIKGQPIYNGQRIKLKKNILYFQSLISQLHEIHFHKELPIFILPATLHEQQFAEHNIIISSFAYPDANGKKYNRIVLNALHTPQDLDRLAALLHTILRK